MAEWKHGRKERERMHFYDTSCEMELNGNKVRGKA